MFNDYFLAVAVPFLFAAFALLQSALYMLYRSGFQPINDVRLLVAAVELIWVAIYCVKFCYFAQFKFYKPPYAYVDAALTQYYWVAIGICIAGFVFTIVQPVIICPKPGMCCTPPSLCRLF